MTNYDNAPGLSPTLNPAVTHDTQQLIQQTQQNPHNLDPQTLEERINLIQNIQTTTPTTTPQNYPDTPQHGFDPQNIMATTLHAGMGAAFITKHKELGEKLINKNPNLVYNTKTMTHQQLYDLAHGKPPTTMADAKGWEKASNFVHQKTMPQVNQHGIHIEGTKKAYNNAFKHQSELVKEIADKGTPVEKHLAKKFTEETAEKATKKTLTTPVKNITKKIVKHESKTATKAAIKGAVKGAGKFAGRGAIAATTGPLAPITGIVLLATDPMIAGAFTKVFSKLSNQVQVRYDSEPDNGLFYLAAPSANGDSDWYIHTEQRDRELHDANQHMFMYHPENIWDPSSTGRPSQPDVVMVESTTDFGLTTQAFDDISEVIQATAQATLDSFNKFIEEPLIEKMLEERTPFLNSLASMPSEYLQPMADTLPQLAGAFNETYGAWRLCLAQSREAIASARQSKEMLGGWFAVPFVQQGLSADFQGSPVSAVQTAETAMTDALENLSAAGRGWNEPKISSGESSGVVTTQLSRATPAGPEGPEVKAPEVKAPQVPNPGVGVGPGGVGPVPAPGLPRIPTPSAPGIKPPDFSGIEDKLGKLGQGKITTPEVKQPGISGEGPRVKAPEVKAPDVKTPESRLSSAVPKLGAPDVKIPDMSSPSSRVDAPKVNTLSTPDIDEKLRDMQTRTSSVRNPASSVDGGVKVPSAKNNDPRTNTSGVAGVPVTAPRIGGVSAPAAPSAPAPSSKLSTVPASATSPRVSSGGGPASPGVKSPSGVNAPAPGSAPGSAPNVSGGKAPEGPGVEGDVRAAGASMDEKMPTSITAQGKVWEFNDPKLAALADKFMHGSSLREAAADVGLKAGPEGMDIGLKVSPKDMRPGDVIIGDNGEAVYLGDGMCLTKDGRVVPVGEMAVFTDKNQGIFRLEANLVSDDAGVTGQTSSAARDMRSDVAKAQASGGVGGVSGMPGARPGSQSSGTAPGVSSQLPGSASKTVKVTGGGGRSASVPVGD